MQAGFKNTPISCEYYGTDGDVLLLIHGLGTNGASWDPLLEIAKREWAGRIIVPDLRGHGLSEHRNNYSFGTMASDLADLFHVGDQVSIVGHSLGGALGALLGSGWFGVNIDHVLALSVKIKWSDDEIAKGRAVAQNPSRAFATRAEAIDRFLKVSGLIGQNGIDRCADLGVVEENGEYRLAADQRIFGCAAGGVPQLLAGTRSRLNLATGQNDPIAPPSDFADENMSVSIIEGAGHQVHLEAPDAVWKLFKDGKSETDRISASTAI
ncbi:MAG: tropinesterase [Sphingomonadales bacterium]|nr:tropinesterase [Sphingomonadales bacterium]